MTLSSTPVRSMLMPLDASAHPGLSLGERTRRWGALREAMDSCSVDCVLTPPFTGSPGAQADSSYLTASPSACASVVCVVPLREEVTAITTCRDSGQNLRDWVGDVRDATDGYGLATLQRLRELPLPHRRIGVAGLASSLRAEQTTPQRALINELQASLPHVEWLDFTDQMRAIRAVKSDEEVGLLRHGALLVDQAFQQAAATARAGIRDYEVWAAAIGTLARGGSEWPLRSRWGAGPRPRLFSRPSHAVLQRGFLILGELAASVFGSRCHGCQAIAVEDCDRIFKDLYAMYEDYWHGCLESLRVGQTIGEVSEACRAAAAKVPPSEGRYAAVSGGLALRSEGLERGELLLPPSAGPRPGGTTEPGKPKRRVGGSSFRAPPADEPPVPRATLAAGWALAFAPFLQLDIDGRVYRAVWGDTVVLRESGPERLGGRAPGLLLAGGI